MKKFLAICTTLLLVSTVVVAQWNKIEDKAGRFSISFPGTASYNETDVPTEIGKIVVKMYSYSPAKGDENNIYTAMYSDYPDSLISSAKGKLFLEEFFKNTIKGSVSNIKGSLLKQSVWTYKGYPGREITVSFGNGSGVMTMKMLLVKSRMYLMQTSCRKGKETNTAIRKFLDSFALL